MILLKMTEIISFLKGTEHFMGLNNTHETADKIAKDLLLDDQLYVILLPEMMISHSVLTN